MSATPTEGAAEAPILFRRGKKRKTYRQRANDNDNDNDETAAASSSASASASAPADQKPTAEDDGTAATVATAAEAANATASEPEAAQTSGGGDDDDDDDADEKGLSVAEVLRLRNARRTKLRGVELRADVGPPPKEDNDAAEADAADKDETALVAGGVVGGGGMTLAAPSLSADKIAGGVGKRFSAQTGLVVELVNRHMLVSQLFFFCLLSLSFSSSICLASFAPTALP